MNPRLRNLTLTMAVLATILLPTAQAAEEFPSKPIRFIIPYAAGGGPDVTTRKITQGMEPRIKQSIIVEARPGGNGMIGMNFVAKSAPDGHTIGYGSSSTLSAAKATLKDPPYDAIKDFSGITIFQEVSFVLLVSPEEKNTPFPQFLDKMRKSPERYSTGAAFVTAEIINNLLSEAAKLKHSYVPYTLAPSTLTDLMGGRLGMAISSINVVRPLIDSGKLHAMAVTSPRRLGILPNVPAIAETYPDVTVQNVNGYFVPSKTPREAVAFLHQKMTEVLKDPELIKWNESSGRAVFMSPQETDDYIRKDEARLMQLYKRAGIQQQ